MPKRKVFIVGGGGMVGSAAAHTLAVKEIVQEIIIIDVSAELAYGQATDISHTTAFTDGVHVRTGTYDEIDTNDIIVITCGVAQKPGQSRRDLLQINAGIIRSVVADIMRQGKEVFILMVSNPVDILTYVALQESGLDKSRVFGTGTTLDTARLRVKLAHGLGVSQRDVNAYILGEHGDSSFPALHGATIGGVPLDTFPTYEAARYTALSAEIRQAAYDIIAAKKATYYGIGQSVAVLVEAMLKPTATIFPVCSVLQGEYGLHNVVLGLPSLVSSAGVTIIDNYPLNEDEVQSLAESGEIVSATLADIQS